MRYAVLIIFGQMCVNVLSSSFSSIVTVWLVDGATSKGVLLNCTPQGIIAEQRKIHTWPAQHCQLNRLLPQETLAPGRANDRTHEENQNHQRDIWECFASSHSLYIRHAAARKE